MMCWMDETSTLQVGAQVRDQAHHPDRADHRPGAQYRLDITACTETRTSCVVAQRVGRVRLRTTQPLMSDEYSRNRATGGFVLIDQATNRTVAAGMITSAG